MVLKTQPASPLETIFEESGSFIALIENSQPDYRQESINGLISARDIPSVAIQRQRANEQGQKPPIEVRFRDGSKRFIHPSTTATMIINRRNLLNSSDENLSSTKISNSSYRQFFQPNFNKRTSPSKPPLVLTIITADDMRQAGVTPTRSSSTSGSDISTITQSPLHTYNSLENIHEASMKELSMTPVRTLSVNNSSSSSPSVLPLSSSKSGVREYSITPQSFSLPSNRSLTMSTQSPSIQSLKASTSSLQITLTNDENERSLPINSNHPRETINQTISQPNTTISITSANRSAFRPFLKPIRYNHQPIAIEPQVPLISNHKSYNPPPQQIVPYSGFHHKSNPPISTTNRSHISYLPSLTQKNAIVPKYSYDSVIPTQIGFDVITNPSTNLKSLLQMNSSNYQKSLNYTVDNSFNLPSLFNIPTQSGQTLTLSTKPTMKWVNITSNSIYDIPRLSSQYSRIPLRITLPVVAPKYNQKVLIRHNTALENRLLNAGLSPETVALYERILEVAENRQKNIFSPPKIVDRYLQRSFF